MKKSDIMNLINSQEGRIRINPICTLFRWTVDPLYNEVVDGLNLEFTNINGMGRFAGIVTIKSRYYDGIIREVEEAIQKRMNDVSTYLITALRNGYSF